MAYMLEVSIVDDGDKTIKVVHQFYGLSEHECETYKREHLAGCEYFRSAEQEGRTIEEWEELEADELPSAEEDDKEED